MLWILGWASVIVVVVLVIFKTRNKKIFQDILKSEINEDEKKTVKKNDTTPLIRTKLSLSTSDIEKIKSELRVMDVEKEITGYALTRLYEAETEGKLNENDRTLLLNKYKESMERIDKDIEKKQMIVKLHDLEKTKTDLMEIFHTKLEEIGRNIENMKATLGIPPSEINQAKTITSQQTKTPSTTRPREKKEEEKKTVLTVRPKSKAEEKIEAIQEEVLKVLERLEQIETEK